MNTSRDFRLQARRALTGKWKKWILLFALAAAFSEAFGLDVVLNHFFSEVRVITVGPASLAYMYPVGFGWILAAVIIGCTLAAGITLVGRYRAARAAIDDEDANVKMIFPWKLMGKCIAMNLVRFVLIWLWSLLLFIPGIVAAYKYSMAEYLLMQNPELGPIDALRESRIRTNGFKLSLLALDLSFLGWMLLVELGSMGIARLINGMQINSVGLLAAVNFIYTVIMWFASAALMVYRITARTLFFMHVEKVRANPFFDDGRQQTTAGNSQTKYAQNTEPEASEEEKSEVEEEPPVDETRAEAMYLTYRCSRRAMRNAGVLEEYEKMHIASYREEIWRRDYGNELMRRFRTDPMALDDLITLAAEYSMDGLADRMMERVERHIREDSLPAADVLNMAGRMLAMFTSGAFERDPGFVARKKAQIMSMADRMEAKLNETNPEGEWRKTLDMIRSMCV